jgi:hypothetical protein
VPEIAVKRINPDDKAAMDAAFELYRDNIERTEQRPEAVFRALAKRPDYRFLGATMYGELIGFAASWAPADAEIWLFEYAAVAPEMRSHGAGANLFFASRVVAGQEKMALVEVDAFMGRDEQAKRLSFYRKLGCKRIAGLKYQLPLDVFGKPPPMWMLALPPVEMASLSVVDVENWLRRIYLQVYDRRLSDPRLAAMIDPLPDEVMLEGF